MRKVSEAGFRWATRYPHTWRLRRRFMWHVSRPVLWPIRWRIRELICAASSHQWRTIPTPWMGKDSRRIVCDRCLGRADDPSALSQMQALLAAYKDDESPTKEAV